MTKSLTLRLPPDLYLNGRQVAKERNMSLNALIQESLAATVRAEQQRQLFDDFTLLAEDADACDVSFAFPAAVEVILSDDSRPEQGAA